MPITAKVIADSIGPAKVRLMTLVLVYPRFIHSEVMTHKMASRCAASSRAIPAKKLRDRTLAEPALPVWWGKNQAGMQAAEEVDDKEAFKAWWLEGLEFIAKHHAEGERRGYHKQIVNRVIEPWMHIEVVFTIDQYGLKNLLKQRRHKDAQPEFKALADAMYEAVENSIPQVLKAGEWHTPFISIEDEVGANALAIELGLVGDERKDFVNDLLRKISTGRCARVSYLNHEGVRAPEEDVALHDRMVKQEPGHWSPLEHIAQALATKERVGNLTGWMQYRKYFPNEYVEDDNV